MRIVRAVVVASITLLAALDAPLGGQAIPRELDGWPVIQLAQETSPSGDIWIGTYGHGVLVWDGDTREWRRIRSDTTETSLSWDFVHAIAFGPRGQVWVGTIGNGWGLSTDDGATWRNWGYSQLGPEWQYVAPNGIRVMGDTTVIATADGLQVTTDDGEHWIAIIDGVGPPAKGPADTAIVALESEYLLTRFGQLGNGRISISYQPREAYSTAWMQVAAVLSGDPSTARPINASALGAADRVNEARAARWAALRDSLIPLSPAWDPPFGRPIGEDGNRHIDQTYRFGSTMGGNFQPHQGVEFNNADGTPVLAIGDGRVVWSGPAERGALTVAIRHDPIELWDGSVRYVYSVYYHNSELLVAVGDSVRRGARIARVGNTGRATNDHLHLEVHASPVDSVGVIVDPEVRFPPHVTNPELWIEPLPGTGMIAGRVFDADGNAVPQARVYGIVKPSPQETPFAFAETYGPRNQPSPMFEEHFAISDVPPGRHRLRVRIGEAWVEETVMVAPGVMTWVELRP